LLPQRPGWTDRLLDFFFEWLAKVRVWSLLRVSFLVGLRIYQHTGTCGRTDRHEKLNILRNVQPEQAQAGTGCSKETYRLNLFNIM